LHKLGIRKGSAPVTNEPIASGVVASKRLLAGEMPADFKKDDAI
jgi:hypothetical protein